MSPGFDLHSRDFLGSPERKRVYTEKVFNLIAREYDWVTLPLSLGRDRAWKRRLIADLPPLAAPVCLDLACGTGHLVGLLARKYPDARITGLDIAAGMLARARALHPSPAITFTRADMSRLPFPDGTVNVVTGGYALRNAPDLDAALAEIARVLKPGACGAFLDFSRSAGRGRHVEYGLLKLWGSFWGLLLHARPDVYAYIAESLRLYPDRLTLRRMLAAHSLRVVHSRRLLGGVLETLEVRKAEAETSQPRAAARSSTARPPTAYTPRRP